MEGAFQTQLSHLPKKSLINTFKSVAAECKKSSENPLACLCQKDSELFGLFKKSLKAIEDNPELIGKKLDSGETIPDFRKPNMNLENICANQAAAYDNVEEAAMKAVKLNKIKMDLTIAMSRCYEKGASNCDSGMSLMQKCENNQEHCQEVKDFIDQNL